MNDRRRNLFVLLAIGAAIVASAVVILTQPTKLGLDLKGGVSLTYQAKPTKKTQVTGDSIQRAIDIMRERVDQFGVSEPEIQRSGTDQIDVSLPSAKNADEAARQVGKTAQLYFYDWEPNVLGPGCKPDPTNSAVTGGSNAGGTTAAISKYDAVQRAATCKPTSTGQETNNGQYYLVDSKTKTVLAGPQLTLTDLKQEMRDHTPIPYLETATRKVVKIPAGAIVVQAADTKPADDAFFVLADQPALTGTDIKDPKQNFDNSTGGTGAPTVTFNFTDKGRKTWQKVTKQIAQRGSENNFGGNAQSSFQHFAIALDNQLISTPYIDWTRNPEGIDGSNGSEISGGFTIKSAQNLANLLKTGALPLRLKLISATKVSAELGKAALRQGLVAGLAGLILVSLFLLAFYRVLGLVAISALAVYGILLFALVKLIPITLTLPGIAGLILTIGVAADANIVIFERVKEEVRAGRSIPVAISQGYRKGLSAIIDANVVTFMVAFILFILATAGVKGFAFTLGVGVLVSFLTAVLLTQAVLGTLGGSGVLSSRGSLGAQSDAQRFHWDFMGASRWFFSLSGVILLIGAFAVGGKGLNLGIDFTSGSRVTAELVQKGSESQIRDTLAPLGLDKAKIQRVTGKEFKSGEAFQISSRKLGRGQRVAVENALSKRFGGGQYSFQFVGPTFGNTVANGAIIAIIASLIVISAYIALRFEWKYAVPVLIALMHDLLITAGVYALFGFEVTTATVAALLTILGYSLYDTIIVFDRVRENVPRMPRAAFSQILNRSMSEVVARSLATSLSTLLPILALLFFGGTTLKDFAFALAIGVLSGTYSSIFIASPVLMHWKEGEPAWRKRRARIAGVNDGVVPAFATSVGGASTEVNVDADNKPRKRLTSPDDPNRGVDRAEWDSLVRDLHADAPPPVRDEAADLLPEDLVLKDEPKPRAPKRPRNSRHGRKR